MQQVLTLVLPTTKVYDISIKEIKIEDTSKRI